MDSVKDRIVRLVRILGKPFDEVITIMWINDEVVIDSIALTEDKQDFELSIFTKAGGEDFESIIPSALLNEEELNNILYQLEEYLMYY